MCPGITLEGPNAIEVWDPEHKNDDSDGAAQHIGADQKLIIKMVSIFRRDDEAIDARFVVIDSSRSLFFLLREANTRCVFVTTCTSFPFPAI